MKRSMSRAAVCVLLAWLPSAAGAQKTQTVRFPAGPTGTTIEASVTGDSYADYKLAVRSGQVMRVTLDPETVYFNILPPGSEGEAIFIGSMEGGSFSGTLSMDGIYTIRVYQMGAAADEGRTRGFTIDVGVK
ncbi:DNA breaking-rejoining protein [Pararhizobium haloflavum]|uniref:DNA breaking-rejoining protein n=1 Tax=Pararhizobium haloflavum TaxID=2037914 RepID=UPI0013001685|nr:DNA breaking-rejoining protein [Pararhizobium haloflavum]